MIVSVLLIRVSSRIVVMRLLCRSSGFLFLGGFFNS